MALSGELAAFSRFLIGIPAFVRERITLEQAAEIVRERMRSRESNFLTLLERSVFSNPRSPYREMLRLAQCEGGDIERMLVADGVEYTLGRLREAGVYVSFEEFKGKSPIIRAGVEIRAEAEDFDNPNITDFHSLTTGGSTGQARRVLLDLDFFRSRLAQTIIGDHAQGTVAKPAAFWFEIPPGHGLSAVLVRVPTGNIPERWFAPFVEWGKGAPSRFGLATTTAVTIARLAGARLPYPEYLPLDRAGELAEWMGRTLARTGSCVMRAQVSKALRVAIAATEKGIDLTGAIITGGSEPPSPAKVARIRASGATFRSSYFLSEVGAIGMSCATSDDPNDQHVLLDHLALTQVSRMVPGFSVEVDAFQFTTLLSTAPKILINVESDDFGVIEDRACGCPFESHGYTRHVRDIRSFSKLTGEGVTLLGSDMERILDEVLPMRFGGTHLDYQLVEEEDAFGLTKLTLIVHPAIPIDGGEDAVVRTVQEALGRMGGAAESTRKLWTQAATLRVRRAVPVTSARGKWVPLRVVRAGSGSGQQQGTP